MMTTGRGKLQVPVRNHYFYGKLLDVYHYELESDYFNNKRHVLNSRVLGWGVVCGLNVKAEQDGIVVCAGLAIDGWGREVVVTDNTRPVTIPADVIARAQDKAKRDKEDTPCVRLMLCYHECLSDPVPVLAGDCNDAAPCEPGAIREQYRLEFRPGCAPKIDLACKLDDVIGGGCVDYGALARWVSRSCPDSPKDPCIPLANIRLPGAEKTPCTGDDIDITCRPIVFNNRLLLGLLVCLFEQCQNQGSSAD
jgi:hypothetical protein